MKKMSLKRFASTALAGVMAISLAVPAFAADKSTEFTGTYEQTTLAVTVPTTGAVAINPYGLPFTMGEGNTVSGQQIATKAPLVIANQSAVALSVSVNTKGVEKGALKLVNAAPSATANEAQVLFQIFEAPTLAGDGVTDTETLNPLFANLKDADAKGSVAVLNATDAANGTDGTDLLVLREADGEGGVQAGGAAFVRLSGKVTKKPTTAWVAADGFTATVVYTFEPSVYAKSAGTFGTAPALDADNGTARNLTLTLPSGVTPTADGIAWTWNSSDGADVTLADASASGAYAVKITPNTKGAVTITATFTGTDGLTYIATSDPITISGT